MVVVVTQARWTEIGCCSGILCVNKHSVLSSSVTAAALLTLYSAAGRFDTTPLLLFRAILAWCLSG